MYVRMSMLTHAPLRSIDLFLNQSACFNKRQLQLPIHIFQRIMLTSAAHSDAHGARRGTGRGGRDRGHTAR